MSSSVIEAVWKKTSPALEQEMAAFWLAERALNNEAAATQRAKQAVCIARNDAGELIAVCTVQPKLVPRLRQRLYYYRTFVGAQHRNSKLVYPMMLAARQALQDYTLALPQPECIGVIIEFENKGLGQAYRIAHDAPSKFTFIGYSPKGLDLRVSYFDGVQLQTPAQIKAVVAANAATR